MSFHCPFHFKLSFNWHPLLFLMIPIIFTVTYSLNFGNGMLKGANKKSGSSDELNRLRN